MKTKIFKKMLAALAACILLSTSFAGGTITVWAGQYYGFDDGTGDQSPYPVFISSKDNYTRDKATIVYCFNKDMHWPEPWEDLYKDPKTIPNPLPEYNKSKGTDELFKQLNSNIGIENPTVALLSVLKNGYPNRNLDQLDEKSSRKVTQLAIWYFTDNIKNIEQYGLGVDEKKAYDDLIRKADESSKKGEPSDMILNIYVYEEGTGDQKKGYQHLLDSTLIPKTEDPTVPEQPEPNVPENPTPTPEGPKDDNLEISSGNSQIIDTVEDTTTGVEGGSQNSVISTEENTDPIVETTQDTQPGMSGQSGNTTIIEDTKKPDTIIGGQAQVVETTQDTQLGMSGQSGNLTTTEDTKKLKKIINKDKATKDRILPQTGDKKTFHLSILGVAITLMISFLAIFKSVKRNT